MDWRPRQACGHVEATSGAQVSPKRGGEGLPSGGAGKTPQGLREAGPSAGAGRARLAFGPDQGGDLDGDAPPHLIARLPLRLGAAVHHALSADEHRAAAHAVDVGAVQPHQLVAGRKVVQDGVLLIHPLNPVVEQRPVPAHAMTRAAGRTRPMASNAVR